MNLLFLLRGSCGSGKSYFIKKNNLELYTISPDNLRIMYGGITFDENGNPSIPQNINQKIWKKVFEILEKRMKDGNIIFIDATHCKPSDILKYKDMCEKYRYRVYIIDFSDVDINIAKQRNFNRLEYKRVPNNVIEKMYDNMKIKPPSFAKIISHYDFKDFINNLYTPIDLSNYKKIHHIGDIHGCYTVLNSYLKDDLKDDEFYIFLGDYFDRGIENLEVFNFLKKNI